MALQPVQAFPMESTFLNMKKAIVYTDDILVTGTRELDDSQNLKAVFKNANVNLYNLFLIWDIHKIHKNDLHPPFDKQPLTVALFT